MSLARQLRLLNLAAAALLGLLAFYLLLAAGRWAAMVLFIGLMIVGPLEDWLKSRWGGPRPLAPSPPAEIIDQGTSLLLILCMILASILG
ncbi:MAG TPA: hypothetical protein VK008_07110 [Sphingobacteriaceae bacterium]|nr:hypothetical protein [Sphingobacteriaceae bacterium]